MLYPPAFNLFLYNALLCHMIKYVDRCIDGRKGQASLWHYVPIIGDYLVPKETNLDLSMEYNEFPKALLNLNYLINALALLPGLVQHRWLAFLVALIVIWNLFVFERVLAFQLTLMWSLWLKDISSLTCNMAACAPRCQMRMRTRWQQMFRSTMDGVTAIRLKILFVHLNGSFGPHTNY
ncbi:uncharacterized protein [Drosophila virilis]|uniref:Uncharacterized protein, isoform B n=1 Tax=Drosophila virilis TaxID=7244 RepID=A0A0Q9WUF0_DROVI|nr:uncharacterized protein LOC6622438 isoform X2 [Drosophila virilis]KRF84815.1 uncharacterized protein Dvir_GJ11642, isoform B [Drosophila virilis]